MTDDANGFYGVYNELFESIKQNEMSYGNKKSFEKAPSFGFKETEISEVLSFYRFWLDYQTSKSFACSDKYNTKQAENRTVRRLMDAENQKLRRAAKKEYNEMVYNLVNRIHRRDDRIAEHNRQKAEHQAKLAAEKEKQKIEDDEARKELRKKQKEEENQMWEEIEEQKRVMAENGRAFQDAESNTDDDNSNEEEEVVYVCDVCRKNFKSEKQYISHERSAKHKQNMKKKAAK